MPKDRARWVIYDFEFNKNEHGSTIKKNKIILMLYMPDGNKKMQENMTINYSKNIFKDKIVEKTGANPNFMEF